MPISLTVNNIPFEYPDPNDSPGWGADATGWAEQVTIALQNLQNTTDIPQTTFLINNNVSSPTNITGLIFNTGLVRAAFISYSLYRTSSGSPSGNAESGLIVLVYDNSASSGNKWIMTQGPVAGLAGVNLTILDNGQMQYTSSNLSGSGYSGNLHFSARTLGQ